MLTILILLLTLLILACLSKTFNNLSSSSHSVTSSFGNSILAFKTMLSKFGTGSTLLHKIFSSIWILITIFNIEQKMFTVEWREVTELQIQNFSESLKLQKKNSLILSGHFNVFFDWLSKRVKETIRLKILNKNKNKRNFIFLWTEIEKYKVQKIVFLKLKIINQF